VEPHHKRDFTAVAQPQTDGAAARVVKEHKEKKKENTKHKPQQQQITPRAIFEFLH